MSIQDTIIQLSKSLFPTGRAFNIPTGRQFEKLISSLSASEARAWLDATAILNSILPDNDSFTIADADDWERRLGLITNEATSLADRKAAIIRKMNHPGTIKARQHYLYIQQQLQDAGFNVYVYENRFGTDYPLISPSSWSQLIIGTPWSSRNATQFIANGASAGNDFYYEYQPCAVKAGHSITLSFSASLTGVVSQVDVLLMNSSFIQVSNALTITGSGSIVNGILTTSSDASYLLVHAQHGGGSYNYTITLDTPIGTILSTDLSSPSTKPPSYFSGIATPFQLNDRQLGQFQLGSGYYPKVVNYIDENSDATFNEGDNFRSTFFIGGSPIGTFANIPESRKDEFRQLILKLKPAQTVAYLFINFI